MQPAAFVTRPVAARSGTHRNNPDGAGESQENKELLTNLPPADQEYLRRWFSAGALGQLDSILDAINSCDLEAAREFLILALSNVLRRVSWQKDDDLRVRKDPSSEEQNAIGAFVAELDRSLRVLLAFMYQDRRPPRSRFSVAVGDARGLPASWARWRGRIDAVITSPPYATALPYLDTDRLSLCFLGLLSRPEHRSRDLQMIGNREITERRRREYWDSFQAESKTFPRSVTSLVTRIDRLNCKHKDTGFRRRNTAALLAKYFVDIRAVLAGIASVVRSEAPVDVVVGRNHTVAGGEKVDINTADLLADIAGAIGFTRQGELPMEMLRSRDIFRQNASESETLLMLRAPAHS